MEILNKEQRYKGTCPKCNTKITCTKEECSLVRTEHSSFNGVDIDYWYSNELGIACPTPCCDQCILLYPYDPTKKWYQFWK